MPIVLAVNAGSSTIKFGLFEARDGGVAALCRGKLEQHGDSWSLAATDRDGGAIPVDGWRAGDAYDATIESLVDWVGRHGPREPLCAVGHRIVHGGVEFTQPTVLDDDILSKLDGLTPLAPLHQPHSLAPVRVLHRLRPELKQVGCFDTAFHRTIAPARRRFAIPRDFEAAGVRRYGFHGLSYEYVAGRLRDLSPALAQGRTVVAHLGSGASLCALDAGRSVDTTMGMTALDGLVMSTRCGALDPGVVLYLLQERGLAPDDVADLLYHRSGLLGLSGTSGDIRELETRDGAAREAIDSFVLSVARETAVMAQSLKGLDGLVFTAGIGEHAADIRARICGELAWLGVRIDERRNAQAGGPARIDGPGSRVEVRVVPTDEERMIALHTLEVLGRT